MTAQPQPIRTFEGPLADAWAGARDALEPVFVPVRPHADDRGWSYMNLMQGVLSGGQINVSTQNPGVIKAWHRHAKQTDFWIALAGHLKVGVWRADDNACWHAVVGDRRPGIVVIPPPLWHGAATVGPEPASLLYYVTQRFDPQQPDEQRAAHDALPGFPWGVQHR